MSSADNLDMTNQFPSSLSSNFQSLNLNTQAGGTFKTSSNMPFSSRLKNGVASGVSMAHQSVAPIVPFVPGAAVMSAMLGNTASNLANAGSGAMPASMGGFTSGGAVGAGGMPVSSPASGGSMFESMQQLQQNMMSTNVYMIGLQQEFNDMNQKYTAISNVLKTKHDTEKNAISNFR